MSASTSCSERAAQALTAIRRGEHLSRENVRSLGEDCPAEFFRIIIEALADSFEPAEVVAYESLMRPWIPETPRALAEIPDRVELVYVLSRVTLGSDIKITSGILDSLKNRFPEARIVLVGSRKTAELFATDRRIDTLEADYPRSGSVAARVQFAYDLRQRLAAENRIVVDPDSRMTQLGLIPACEPEHYFHFPSRSAGADTEDDLSCIARKWFRETFGGTPESGFPYIAPDPVEVGGKSPRAAVSLGVGENEEKRVSAAFETALIRALAERYQSVWVDRGAGGEEAKRVTAAVEESGAASRVHYWQGSFAGFASIICQSELYVGYDSAGQHAAAATGTPLITIFAGAPSARFLQRWKPYGEGKQTVIEADGLSADAVHRMVLEFLS